MTTLNIDNDIDLSTIQNENQNDELLEINEEQPTKKKGPRAKKQDIEKSPVEEIGAIDDMIYKTQLIHKIRTYKKYFGKFLTEIKTESLEGKSIEEL